MVEKRMHPLLGLLWNQFMYAVVSFVIVTTVKAPWQLVFGLFFFFLYLSGVYGYAKKAGTGHQKSYSKIKPHAKFPTAYALVAIGYFLIPLGIAYLLPYEIVRLIVIFWEAPFFFGGVVTMSGFSILPMAIFSGVIIVFTYLGYLAGVKQFSVSPYIVKLLYRPVKKDETNK